MERKPNRRYERSVAACGAGAPEVGGAGRSARGLALAGGAATGRQQDDPVNERRSQKEQPDPKDPECQQADDEANPACDDGSRALFR